jgi:predicted DNA-binding transcriptional regulator YafY
MATNKHALIRYHALDRCFRNTGRLFFIDDLIEECNRAIYEHSGIEDGVKKRQVYEDIAFMESEAGWGIELERTKRGRKVTFRYADPNYSIGKEPLSDLEKNQIQEVLLTLGRFKGMPQFEWVEDISARLQTIALPSEQQLIIEFEQNPFLKGLELFTPLFNAILYKRPLNLIYQSFKEGRKMDLLIHPYYLKQYNQRWFLFGWNQEQNFLMNLALDRIQSVSEAQATFLENSSIDFTEYFEDVVGVSIPKDSETEIVVLEISKERWPYIETKPLHGSQKVLERKLDIVRIQLNIKINNELFALLFSYADAIEVIEPASLRERCKSISQNLFSKYSKRLHLGCTDELHLCRVNQRIPPDEGK